VADTVKVLGQLNPSATTLTDLYTVPGATQVVASSLVICNQNAVAVTFRVSVAVAGAGDDPKQYLYYGQSLAANATFIATIGISLAATDVVRVWASSTAMSFNLYGVETT
jgi:hypothetical protein